MQSMSVIARAVIADAIRRKVIWVVVVFGALLAFTIPSLPSFGQGVAGSVFREVSLTLTFVAALLVTVVFSATRIPTEVERRMVYNVLARDVARWQYIVGTWAGISAVVGIVVVLVTTVAVGAGWFAYGEPMFVLFAGALGIWLECAVLAGVAMLASTRFSSATSIVAVLAFVFVGHSVASLLPPAIQKDPWWVPTLNTFNVINPVAHGTGYSLTYGAVMLVHAVVWCALLLILASASFAKRDL